MSGVVSNEEHKGLTYWYNIMYVTTLTIHLFFLLYYFNRFESHQITWDFKKSLRYILKSWCPCCCRSYGFVDKANKSLLGDSWASISNKIGDESGKSGDTTASIASIRS